jgi:multiple sugar transport system ATP-binding protein
MSDKMAVMNGGFLQQYDTPDRVFASPINTFVAGFVGSPAMSLIPLDFGEDGGEPSLHSPDGWSLPLSAANAQRARRASSRRVILGARHSTLKVHLTATPGAVRGTVYTVEPTGDITFLQVYLGSQEVMVSVEPHVPIAPDQSIWLEFDQGRLHIFDGETQQALVAA